MLISGMKRAPRRVPKYQRVVDHLVARIVGGSLTPGSKIPSEAMLVKQFSTSRITVGRAMRELQQRGLIERYRGSGSYVRADRDGSSSQLIFGLLIPDLGETEIFEPICQGIASAPEASEHALLWGHAGAIDAKKSDQALQLCEQFIARRVSGVFFAPLEFEHDAGRVNARILSQLAGARIPVVLLDRRPAEVIGRNRPDLVGVNNRHAGHLATEHLIRLGCKRIGFMAFHGSASTIHARYDGYRQALAEHGLGEQSKALVLSESDQNLSGHEPVEAYVCINDWVAGQLMHAFLARKIRVPEDIRIVGIDDVRYADLLPVPLTTVRQPCREIGAIALSTMLDRIRNPRMPSRDVLLDGDLVIRQSCGASMTR